VLNYYSNKHTLSYSRWWNWSCSKWQVWLSTGQS